MVHELEMGCRGGVGGGASGRGGAAEGGVNVGAGVRPGPELDNSFSPLLLMHLFLG